MIGPIQIIERYYPTDTLNYCILLTHSQQAAELAFEAAHQHPELACDRRFAYEGVMLRDIGVCLTDTPTIGCHGTEPYPRHGYLGGQLPCELGLERHARVAEHHTGIGLDNETIHARGLDLPTDRLHMPQSIEERIIYYADKFYSKIQLEHQKPLEEVRASFAKFGADSLARFDQMHEQFQVPNTLVQSTYPFVHQDPSNNVNTLRHLRTKQSFSQVLSPEHPL